MIELYKQNVIYILASGGQTWLDVKTSFHAPLKSEIMGNHFSCLNGLWAYLGEVKKRQRSTGPNLWYY